MIKLDAQYTDIDGKLTFDSFKELERILLILY